MPTVTIRFDRQTMIFWGGLLFTIAGPFWGFAKEMFDALTIYTAQPPDWHHIWTSHGPQIIAAAGGFYGTMKAMGLVPVDVQEELAALRDIKEQYRRVLSKREEGTAVPVPLALSAKAPEQPREN